MRCPNCGTESASSSPRCALCDAPLVPPGAADATAQDNTAGAGDTTAQDPTTRDPFSAPPSTWTPNEADATVQDTPYRNPPPGGTPPEPDDATVQGNPYGIGPMGGAPASGDDATVQGNAYGGAPYGGSPMGGAPPNAEDATLQGDPYGSAPYGGSPMGGAPPNADDATLRGDPYGSAPYGGSPMGGVPAGGDDATLRGDPYGGALYGGGQPGESAPGGVPVPRDPVPPPWADQGPVQWEPRPEHTLHMAPGEERTTHLSPEPWAAEPWSEPAIWQPPAPPKRSMLPYFLGAAGVVLLLGVALGIVFWPSGSSTSPPAASEPSTGQSPSAASASPASSGDLEAQAGAVNDLLEEMGGTRSELGSVVTQGCPVSGVQRVLDSRRGELEKARALDVSALDNGAEMKAALVRALEASTESNQRYLDGAPGCPSDSEVADVNQRASSAKSEFIGYWNPVAQKAGLPARTEGDI
ncbi:hypothetical protein [Actinomadura luteofluorescens]|uniref:hypothetical protein n=1 Tax=Actinomadura luteofluorescens TaxID=46163 RepID=UPI003D8F21C6